MKKEVGAKNTSKNHLIQLKTGEGKSVILALTASLLALFGFDVNVACYSRYLSERDKKDFENLFKFLGIEDKIRYGTFNSLCEAILNKKVNVRDTVVQKILKNAEKKVNEEEKKQSEETKQALLIDEVDVLFSKEFFGNMYYP